MQRKRRSVHHYYSVYSVAYADEASRAMIKRAESPETWMELLKTTNFYNGTSQAQTERAFSLAALMAMNNPLAREVFMKRDHEVIIRLKTER